MNKIITKSFKDLFSGMVLAFIAKTTLISLAVTAAIAWLFGSTVSSFVKHYMTWIPWEWVQTTGASVAVIAIAYMLFVAIHAVVTSFMVEPLLAKLAQKHYPNSPVISTPSIVTSLLISLRSAAVFLVVFLFTFPLMFVPLLGAVYMLWLWSILIKAPTLYDVGSMFISDKAVLKSRSSKTTLLAMIATGFNYIPLLNIFSPVFAQILFLHRIVGDEELEIRN
ncbi:Probable transmembrane protein [hydrothermal vent metagenome]|uniref:Probable transmembrane protein n=1 Tax=hydrothermal vent metagenome TaxID=652676 RepID=A0A1W1EAC6_9ZZZZ